MTASRPPTSSSLMNVKELGSGKRLSLAVARLDDLIARLNHLPELANRPFSQNGEDKPLSHQTLVVSVLPQPENSVK